MRARGGIGIGIGIAAAGNLQDRPQAPALPYTIQDQDRGHELELGPCFTDKAPRVGSLEAWKLGKNDVFFASVQPFQSPGFIRERDGLLAVVVAAF